MAVSKLDAQNNRKPIFVFNKGTDHVQRQHLPHRSLAASIPEHETFQKTGEIDVYILLQENPERLGVYLDGYKTNTGCRLCSRSEKPAGGESEQGLSIDLLMARLENLTLPAPA